MITGEKLTVEQVASPVPPETLAHWDGLVDRSQADDVAQLSV
jgi:hypothetical protein